MTGKVPDAGSNREHQIFLGALQTQPLGGAWVHKSGQEGAPGWQPRSRHSARGAEMHSLCSETATLRGDSEVQALGADSRGCDKAH